METYCASGPRQGQASRIIPPPLAFTPVYKMIIYGLALACVIGLSIGQILFKMAALAWTAEQSLWATKPLTLTILALALYGSMTFAWIWILRMTDLGRVYPLMSIAFILVPLGSAYFFGERFGMGYYLGVSFIILGLLMTLKASSG